MKPGGAAQGRSPAPPWGSERVDPSRTAGIICRVSCRTVTLDCSTGGALVATWLSSSPDASGRCRFCWLTEEWLALGVEGLQPFPMILLHFRRTFVEKLFAIHGKVERLKEDGTALGHDVRHYADLYVLGGRLEVTAMLAAAEYEQIKTDYDDKSREFYPHSYRPPTGLRFDQSDALSPSEELRAMIEPGYEQECRRLFFRPYPAFVKVLERFEGIRDLL